MDLKDYIVEYVGNKKSLPEDSNVSIEMVVDVLSDEFPELMLMIAQENYMRGYVQALDDVEAVHNDIDAERLNSEN